MTVRKQPHVHTASLTGVFPLPGLFTSWLPAPFFKKHFFSNGDAVTWLEILVGRGRMVEKNVATA